MDFFKEYLNDMAEKMMLVSSVDLTVAAQMMTVAKQKGKKVILVGNGGSASIASHVTVDLTKNAGIRAVNFNESCMLTAFANDCGYEEWVDKAIGYYADPGDVIVLISSSGTSENIIKGARKAREMGLKIITLTGFDPQNPLKQMGDINFYVESWGYNIVEIAHSAWLVAVVDKIIGKTEYTSTENVEKYHEPAAVLA